MAPAALSRASFPPPLQLTIAGQAGVRSQARNIRAEIVTEGGPLG